MSGGNVPSIAVRSLVGGTTASVERRLDDETGRGSLFTLKCPVCAGELEFDTDGIGRSIERCRECGHVPPSRSRTAPLEPSGLCDRCADESTKQKPLAFAPNPAGGPELRLCEKCLDKPATAAPAPSRMPEPSLHPSTAPRKREPSPQSEPTMPRGIPSAGFAAKACANCTQDFIPSGSRQRFCSEECKQSDQAPTPTKVKKKGAKVGKGRKPVRTGFQGESPRSTRSASSSGIAGAIEKIEEEIASLDAQRERLLGAIESLREFDAA